jgi:flagellar basal-body rod protein FlgF
MNGLYLAASGAASLLAGLDVAANNLANVDTPGFRRLLDVTESLGRNGSPYEYASLDSSPTLDTAQGPLKATGNPLDIAISGPAFIEVQTPDGPAYTRNGQMQVGPDGTLLAAGFPVVRQGGGTMVLPPGSVSVGGDGSVTVNGAPQGKIALADPRGATLTPVGGSLYHAAGLESLPPGDAGSQIHQGFIESSTTSEVGEVVGMMGAMRGYEAAMKAVTTIDQNQDRTVQAFTLQA